MANKKSEQDEKAKELEFELESPNGISSGSSPVKAVEAAVSSPVQKEADVDPRMADPLFRLLAEPKLPELTKRDRARLQLQSPNRIHFYWSVKNNPFGILKSAFGDATNSYTLVARLRNLTTGEEGLIPVDARGNWWFDVDDNCTYKAEIGFYAPNRPYFRVVYSNEVTTPRKSPSNRTDYTPSFSVSAGEFAEVLDAAGYKRDAFDVALAGDDRENAIAATDNVYFKLTGKTSSEFSKEYDADLRFVLLALSAGYSLEEIEPHVNPTLFKMIKNDLARLSAAAVLSALKEEFDIVSEEFEEIEEIGEAVFGASLVNFPRNLRRRNVPRSLVPKLDELSNPGSVTSRGRME